MPRNGRGGERVTGADTHGPVGGASQGVHLRDHAEVAEVVLDGRRAVGVRLLNGTTIVDADLDTVTDPEVLKKHPGLARTTGRIGFLGHGALVEFRNLRIKELK